MINAYGIDVTADQEVLSRRITPYGMCGDDSLPDFLEKNRICKWQQGVWVFCTQRVDVLKRLRDKDGKSYRSQSIESVYIPYMAYAFEYVVQRFADLHEISREFAIKKIVSKNLDMRSHFSDLDEKNGYVGLSQIATTTTANKKTETQQIPQESIPF